MAEKLQIWDQPLATANIIMTLQKVDKPEEGDTYCSYPKRNFPAEKVSGRLAIPTDSHPPHFYDIITLMTW